MRPLRAWIASALGSPPPRCILFRVDAGPVGGLSFGHLSRCLLLAQTLQSLYDCEITFVMRPLTEGVRHARRYGMAVRSLPETVPPENLDAALQPHIHELHPDWVFIDLPYVLPDIPEVFKSVPGNTRFGFIDDARFRNPGATVYLNSSILAPQRVRPAPGDPATYLLGPDYFLFQPPDEMAGIRTPGRFNVLITLGGSDPTGLTLKILSCLRTHPWPGTLFRIILGPGFQRERTVRSLIRGLPAQWDMVVSPPDLLPYLAGCDLVVCAGGRTLYEATGLQKTALPIASTAIESEAIAAFIHQRKLAQGLVGWDASVFLQAMARLCPPFPECEGEMQTGLSDSPAGSDASSCVPPLKSV